MSNREILAKAINKAAAGGWTNPPIGVEVSPDTDIIKLAPMFIFNHNFAKALWGEKDLWLVGHTDKYDTSYPAALPQPDTWQYHLQQMVIADAPIKYLGENI